MSKAEGNLVKVPGEPGPERDAAKAAVLAGQTARVVATRGPTQIVATHHGFVMAAGGIDESNVDQEHVVLLPEGSGRLGPRAAGRTAGPVRARRRRDRVGHDGPAVARRADRCRARRRRHGSAARLPGRARHVRQRAAASRRCRRSTRCAAPPSWSRASTTRCRSRSCAGLASSARPTARARRRWSEPPIKTCSPSVRRRRAPTVSRMAARLDGTRRRAVAVADSRWRPDRLDGAIERAIAAAGPSVTWTRDGTCAAPRG